MSAATVCRRWTSAGMTKTLIAGGAVAGTAALCARNAEGMTAVTGNAAARPRVCIMVRLLTISSLCLQLVDALPGNGVQGNRDRVL
jgi:hypothetical protein